MARAQDHLVTIVGHLVTILGCVISLASFCLLPYLVGTNPSFAFTGLQLVTLGSPILLPPDPKFYSIPSEPPPELQLVNIPFIWVPLLLVALLLLAAVGDLVLTRTSEPARRGITRGILIVASLTLCFSLCSYGYNLVLNGFVLIGRAPIIRGSLFTPGFLGLLVGLVVALIGSMMTLRAKR